MNTCPQCGKSPLRVLTWRQLGIQETSLMCWDCDWITFPEGVTKDNWKQLMEDNKNITRDP